MTRRGVFLALDAPGFSICAAISDAAGAVEAALREQPDVCLIAARVPGSGIAATAEITAKLPDTPVVVLAEEPSEPELLDALRAGACGYLLEDTSPDRLPFVLRGVLRGEAAIPRVLVARLVDEFRRRSRRLSLPGSRGVELTPREWEVLELLEQGLGTKEIATRLFISHETVRTHVAAILRKLHVPDRRSLLELLHER